MPSPLYFMRCYGYATRKLPWLMVTPFTSARRSTIRRVATAAGWRGLPTAMPTCTLHDLLPTRPPVRVDASTVHPGNVTFYELFVISQLVAARQPGHLFEFGTHNGRSTLHMAMNSPAEAHVTTIDLPVRERNNDDGTIVGGCYRDTPWAEKITQLHENTWRFDPSPYAGTMNFIFIDAGHEYDDVCNDTDLALRMARPSDCLILWHDYSQWPGVQQAMDERYATGGRYAGLRHILGTSMAVLDLAIPYEENKRRRSARRAARPRLGEAVKADGADRLDGERTGR